MYADIEKREDGSVHWNEPSHYGAGMPSSRPLVLNLVEALSAAGVFTRAGLQAVSEIWGAVDFHDSEGFHTSRDLTRALFARLDEEKLVTEAATQDHARYLMSHWQMPMYHLDFREVAVSLEELEARREASLWAEAGYHPAYG
jgi:hypothetical protein